MALIKCPECGKEISDKADKCINCGFPLEEFLKKHAEQKCPECNSKDIDAEGYCNNCGYKVSEKAFECKRKEELYTICPKCGNYNNVGQFACKKCGYSYKINDYKIIDNIKRCCPNCRGINYHAFVEEVVIREGKTKSKTTLNLNPFKPFTLFNHSEKLVRKPITATVSKFVCDDCGKIFNK